jgi:multidrug efflux system membrane fusion protein
VEQRDLKVGLIQDGRAVIERGVAPGDRVVTSGYYRLTPGAKVQVTGGGEKTARRGAAKASNGAEVE